MDTLDHKTQPDLLGEVNTVDSNNAPMVYDDKTVEGRLWTTLKALAAEEGNIRLFNTLMNKGLATNDVRNFTNKQLKHRKVIKCADYKTRKSAMKSKLADSLAFVARLRQQRNALKKKVLKKHAENKSHGKQVMSSLVERYRRTKLTELAEADKKIIHLEEKDIKDSAWK